MENNIISFNADGRLQATINLILNTHGSKPIAIAIQDPPAHLSRMSQVISQTGYTLQSLPNSVKDNIILTRTDSNPTPRIHHHNDIALSIEITYDNKKFLLISIYIRPRIAFSTLKRALDDLKQCISAYGQSKVITTGDLNATDPQWAPPDEVSPELCSSGRRGQQLGQGHYRQIKLTRGRHLAAWFDNLKLTCLNDPSTFNPSFIPSNQSSRGSHIDVTHAGNKAIRIWSHVTLIDTGTQHKAILIKAKETTRNVASNPQISYRPNKITMTHFQALDIEFKPLTHNLPQLNNAQLADRAEKMTRVILKHLINAQNSASTHSSKSQSQRSKSTAWSRIRLYKLTTRLDKLQRRGRNPQNKRAKPQASTRPASKTLHAQRRLRKQIIDTIRQSLLPEQANISQDIWTRINATRHLLLSDGEQLNAQSENMSINKLEEIATEKFGPPDDTHRSYAHHHSTSQNSTNIYCWPQQIHISLNETAEAIRMVRNRKFTGPDGLRYATLLRASQFILETLHTWVATCFRASITPHTCKTTHGVIIPKKVPGKYRIVHVGSPLTSLLERVALSRMEHIFERRNLFHERQYGFSACIDRHDLVTRVTELAIRNTLRENVSGSKKFTTVISLDIRGAFDNVDQAIIQQKLIDIMQPDPIRIWLSNFITNRRIILKHEQLRSTPRLITRGVPQGSILGPTLWNFTINELDQGFTLPNGELELLAYADDLIIVYLGNDYQFLQNQINTLVRSISALKLEIDPDKCSITHLRYNPKRLCADPDLSHTPTINILGHPISKTPKVSILGIPITHQMRLDLDSATSRISIRDNAQLLNCIKRLGIVKTAEEWRVLLNSLLTSSIVLNYLPILAIDKTARDWCDKAICRAIKRTFDWPNNSSNKVSRLLTGMHANTEALVRKAIGIKITRPNGNGYRLLHTILHHKQDLRAIKGIAAKQSLDEDNISSHLDAWNIWSPNMAAHIRRYHDPICNSLTNIIEHADLSKACEAHGPVWLLIEGAKSSTACEILGGTTILQIRAGRHCEYPNGYFNSMGMAWVLTNSNDITNKTMVFPNSCSLLQALRNMSNRDWRIITLREKLQTEGWSICTINKETYSTACARISHPLERKPEANPNNENEPLAEEERAVLTNNDYQNLIWLTWPPTDDYHEVNIVKQRFDKMTKQLAVMNHSSITSILLADTDTWARLNPGWISGKSALMLSGLVLAGNILRKGKLLAPGDTPEGCNIDQCRIPTTVSGIPESNSHATLHRAFHCPRFKEARSELRRIMNNALSEEVNIRAGYKGGAPYSLLTPWKYPNTFRFTLANPRFAQSFIKTLTNMAMS